MSQMQHDQQAASEQEVKDDDVLDGEPVSAWDTFLYDWWHESLKRNIPVLNDVLRSLLTLSTALAGGTLLFTSQPPTGLRLLGAMLFILALASSLVGVLPFTGKGISRGFPDQVFQHKKKAERFKKRAATIAASLIVAGLVSLFVAAMFTAPSPPSLPQNLERK